MTKKYRVTLTDDERRQLHHLVEKRNAKSIQVKRAYILLAADEHGEQAWDDAQIQRTYGVGRCTVERVRQRWVEEGLSTAVYGKKREVFKAKRLDGTVEAHLIALRCSAPPNGRKRWTLQLLADQMVSLQYVEAMSLESVRQILKKTRSSRGKSKGG